MRIITIFLVCLILVIIFLYKYNKYSEKYSQRYFIHTSFKEIDHEHQEMADALDKFLSLCIKHWETEERLYKEGKMKIPPNHPQDIEKLWQKHNQQHKDLIDRINQMKTDINTHIKEYDVPHFHFGPN